MSPLGLIETTNPSLNVKVIEAPRFGSYSSEFGVAIVGILMSSFRLVFCYDVITGSFELATWEMPTDCLTGLSFVFPLKVEFILCLGDFWSKSSSFYELKEFNDSFIFTLDFEFCNVEFISPPKGGIRDVFGSTLSNIAIWSLTLFSNSTHISALRGAERFVSMLMISSWLQTLSCTSFCLS